VGRRLVERLQYIRLWPRRIWMWVAAQPRHVPVVGQYPHADWIGLDISERHAESRRSGSDAYPGGRWLRGASSQRVAGDAGRLPIADDSIDLVFSNLMLHWHPEPHAVFPEWKRVLKPTAC
jgi:malonyl-CoA O-methyltransferase